MLNDHSVAATMKTAAEMHETPEIAAHQPVGPGGGNVCEFPVEHHPGDLRMLDGEETPEPAAFVCIRYGYEGDAIDGAEKLERLRPYSQATQ
jgi:hypothetical protein